MLGIAIRIHALSPLTRIPLHFVLLFCCPLVWAAQDAIVVAERAVIYADKTMTSPVGYVSRGKRVTIGEIPRNKSQLYPIIVSGKIAYIRVLDISTELDYLDSNRLVAERFFKASKKKIAANYAFSGFTYPSQVSLATDAGQLKTNDAFVFNGFQIKGSTRTAQSWDLGVALGYAEGKEGIETFRMVETGADFSYRIYTGERFILRWQNQFLGVPFATYSLGDRARVNGYGFSLGTGLNANWVVGERFGIEAYGGFHYTKLFSFDIPDPTQTVTTGKRRIITLDPAFVGTRMGIGATYQF